METKCKLLLKKAKSYLQIADHMTYVTFPLIKENRLILKILEEINLSIINLINAALEYEYIHKRINLHTEESKLSLFKKISQRYNIHPEQLQIVKEILATAEEHKKSPMEFVKKDKIVILIENRFSHPKTLTIETIKYYLLETKDILRKIRNKIET